MRSWHFPKESETARRKAAHKVGWHAEEHSDVSVTQCTTVIKTLSLHFSFTLVHANVSKAHCPIV